VQLSGEQTKHQLNEDARKRRARMTMERVDCDGWLHITLDDDDLGMAVIRMTHYQCHHPYTDISIMADVGTGQVVGGR
jgi:hypothetical protein